jgi:hypothetical protein
LRPEPAVKLTVRQGFDELGGPLPHFNSKEVFGLQVIVLSREGVHAGRDVRAIACSLKGDILHV